MWSYTHILFNPVVRSYLKNASPAYALKDNVIIAIATTISLFILLFL